MNFEPLFDKVLVTCNKQEVETKTAGGLYIPETAQVVSNRLNEGTVVAIGKGHWEAGKFVPLEQVKVGDRVLFNEYAGVEVKVDGQSYLLLRANEFLGRFAKPIADKDIPF
jgi:chaperonin GroES